MPPPSALIGLPISGAKTNQPITSPSGSVAGAASSSDRVRNPTREASKPIGEHSRSSNTSAGPSGLTAAASTAATLTNLLLLSNMKGSNAVEGVYVGDGRPPIPAKLALKIQHWEFVDMGELLPEFSQSDDEATVKRPWMTKKPQQVTDIFTWMQCFTTYVSVLGPVYPEAIPELMAYAAAIIRVSQDFAGLAWQRYDSGFCRQAAITGNRQWSRINATLYTMCFTGKALAIARCELCFATRQQSVGFRMTRTQSYLHASKP